MSRTSMMLGLSPANLGSEIALIVIGKPVTSTARFMAKMLPTTNGRHTPYTFGSDKAFTTTSGPIPQGSPMVMAIDGRSLVILNALLHPYRTIK